MRMTSDARERKARRRAGASAVQRAVTRYGFDVVAGKIGTTEQTIRNWNTGANEPTPFMAGIILSKFNPDGTAR